MPKIDTAMDKVKALYGSKVKVGKIVLDVTDCFPTSPSRAIRNSLKQGMRVYALPLINGKGIFEKYQLDKNKKLVRDKKGKPIVKLGPKQIVASLVCSPQAKNIGSDELLVEGEESIEGIKREEAMQVFKRLRINQSQDSYVIFIRRPAEINVAVQEFTHNLRGILTHGRKFKITIRLSHIPMDARFFRRFVGQAAGQVHPLVRGKVLARMLGDTLGHPEMRERFLPHIRRATQTGRKIRGKTPK